MAKKEDSRAEFGDFQTPVLLAEAVCSLLRDLGAKPAAIVEPTCGVGNLLLAAANAFPNADTLLGADINTAYVAVARRRFDAKDRAKIDLRCGNFFNIEWEQVIGELPEPVLVIGNPPWVTNADLGSLGSENLPKKMNHHGHSGLDAMTGKSNFDISEWMLVRLLEWLRNKRSILAMLCKTAVARKALFHAWSRGLRVRDASLYSINASLHFGAAVDAGLLVIETGTGQASYDCRVFPELDAKQPTHAFGYRDEQLVADVNAYDDWKHLQGPERCKWRSGIKHDCSAVMELHRIRDGYATKSGEKLAIESDLLYPMFKSSDIAGGRVAATDRYMIVPQKSVGEDTAAIEICSPLTWAYLQKNRALFDRRGSSIYRNRPPFSIFGVGSYTFFPWKVAISGFYKSLKFQVIGPICDKPVVFDDTCNFISCKTPDEAHFIGDLLNSTAAAGFFKAFIFWDAKRPLTIDLLKRIDLQSVAVAVARGREAELYLSDRGAGERKRRKEIPGTLPSLFDGQRALA